MTNEPEQTDYTKVESPDWYQAVEQLSKRRGWRLGSSVYGLVISVAAIVLGILIASSMTPLAWAVVAAGVYGIVLFTWRLATIRRHPW